MAYYRPTYDMFGMCINSTATSASVCYKMASRGIFRLLHLLRQPCASSALMPLSHRECIQSVHYPLNIMIEVTGSALVWIFVILKGIKLKLRTVDLYRSKHVPLLFDRMGTVLQMICQSS